jgi:hypothetical protein
MAVHLRMSIWLLSCAGVKDSAEKPIEQVLRAPSTVTTELVRQDHVRRHVLFRDAMSSMVAQETVAAGSAAADKADNSRDGPPLLQKVYDTTRILRSVPASGLQTELALCNGRTRVIKSLLKNVATPDNVKAMVSQFNLY